MKIKTENERYTEIASQLENYEDVMDFVKWYAEKLNLMTFIDDDGVEVESDLAEAIHDTRNAFETEFEQPTRNWKQYKQTHDKELYTLNSNFEKLV